MCVLHSYVLLLLRLCCCPSLLLFKFQSLWCPWHCLGCKAICAEKLYEQPNCFWLVERQSLTRCPAVTEVDEITQGFDKYVTTASLWWWKAFVGCRLCIVTVVAAVTGDQALWLCCLLECCCVFSKRREYRTETVSVANDSVFEQSDSCDHAPGVRYSAVPVEYCLWMNLLLLSDWHILLLSYLFPFWFLKAFDS